jgi:hypothetical protein
LEAAAAVAIGGSRLLLNFVGSVIYFCKIAKKELFNFKKKTVTQGVHIIYLKF